MTILSTYNVQGHMLHVLIYEKNECKCAGHKKKRTFWNKGAYKNPISEMIPTTHFIHLDNHVDYKEQIYLY